MIPPTGTSKNINFRTIVKDLKLSPKSITAYINLDNKKTTENKIYNSRKDKIEILEDDGSYIFYNQDGDTYVGEFRDGKQIGKGIYTWVSGGKYTGDFKDNKMHGYGTFIRNNIGTYVGEFKEGVFHGQGTYTLVNGEIVNGPWNNGVPVK